MTTKKVRNFYSQWEAWPEFLPDQRVYREHHSSSLVRLGCGKVGLSR